MTREEKIIATAFTGKMFIDGSEMDSLYEYMGKKVGHGVIDLMLTSKEFWEELHKACEQDFIDMVSKEEPSLPSSLDEAAKEYNRNYTPFDQCDSRDIIRVFKAGVEWMAGQGSSREVEVKEDAGGYPYIPDIELYDYDKDEPLFKPGDKVIVQIRKK